MDGHYLKGEILDLNNVNSIEDLDHEQTAKLVLDMFNSGSGMLSFISNPNTFAKRFI